MDNAKTTGFATLKEGMSYEGPALILTRKESTTKKWDTYLDLVLCDKGGKLGCKIWGYSQATYGDLAQGSVVHVELQVSTYNGSLQGKITSVSPSPLNPEDFVLGTRFDAKKMEKDILDLVEGFKEPLTKYITASMIGGNINKFRQVPAATGMHNNWLGGLLEHVWSMIQIAENIVNHYRELYQVPLSREKVLFGVICHDMGKTVEYGLEGVTPTYTGEGILTPHIVEGIGMVYLHAAVWYSKNKELMTPEEFNNERRHLTHILASHHGKMEWGSPVVPSTLEAVLVHQIDMVDSQFMHALGLVEGREGDIKGFSEKSFAAGTRFMMYTKE